MSQIKKGAILSYLNIILTNIIGLALTPFMIRKLGNADYGLYTLIGSLIAYVSVLDLGLNNTIIRFVSRYRTLKDKKGEENFLAITMAIYAFISVLILLIGLVAFQNLNLIFSKLTVVEMDKAKIMFIVLIFNLAITLPGGAFTAIANAYEHFVFPRALLLSKYLLRAVLLVFVLLLGGDSLSVVYLDTIVNLLIISISIYYVFIKLKVKIKLYLFESILIKQIFRYSFWIFVFAIVGQLQWQSGQIILGIKSGTKEVAVYGVGIMLGTYYGAFSTAISSLFLPRATQMTTEDRSNKQLTDEMIKIGRFSLIILMLILGGFLLFGKQFIELWVGKSYMAAWFIALVIMFSYTLPLIQSFANSILESKGLFSFKAKTYITLIFSGIFLGYMIVEKFGIKGLVLSSVSGWIISQVIMNFFYLKKLNLEIKRFFLEVFKNLLPVFLIVLFIGVFINYLPGIGWVNLIFKITLFGLFFSVLIYKFGMNSSEKILVNSVFKIKSYLKK